MRIIALPLLALLAASPVLAQEQAAEPPPALPESVPDSNTDLEMEPQVVIIQRGRDVIKEYRVGGRIYMLEIQPSMGPPYYLIDTDGDGSLETRRRDLDDPPAVQWRLFKW